MTDELYLQNDNGSERVYDARELRFGVELAVTGGVVEPGVDFALTAGGGRVVNVAAGVGAIVGTEQADQGVYAFRHGATTVTVDSADVPAVGKRKIRFYKRAYDTNAVGSHPSDGVATEYVAGTVVDLNQTPALPALPPSSTHLGEITVDQNTGSFNDAMFTSNPDQMEHPRTAGRYVSLTDDNDMHGDQRIRGVVTLDSGIVAPLMRPMRDTIATTDSRPLGAWGNLDSTAGPYRDFTAPPSGGVVFEWGVQAWTVGANTEAQCTVEVYELNNPSVKVVPATQPGSFEREIRIAGTQAQSGWWKHTTGGFVPGRAYRAILRYANSGAASSGTRSYFRYRTLIVTPHA